MKSPSIMHVCSLTSSTSMANYSGKIANFTRCLCDSLIWLWHDGGGDHLSNSYPKDRTLFYDRKRDQQEIRNTYTISRALEELERRKTMSTSEESLVQTIQTSLDNQQRWRNDTAASCTLAGLHNKQRVYKTCIALCHKSWEQLTLFWTEHPGCVMKL